MRKKDKFIFYFFGLISPLIFVFFWIFLSVLIVSTTTSIFGYQSIGFFVLFVLLVLPSFLIFVVTKLHGNAIKKYKSLGGKISKGFFNISVFCWWIISFAVVSAVLLPALLSPVSPRYTSAVKNGLVNGVKECVIREADNQTTKFKDVRSYSEEYRRFKIQPLDPGSCFKAKAFPEDKRETWFEIELNTKTGNVSKTCGDSSKPGCGNGNTW
jgi:hypothetical protein